MAGFKTHITTSSILGIGYGAAGVVFWDMPLPTAVLAGGLCGVSGMLPDLDSDSGVPLRESLALAAAVVPMFMLSRFQHLGWSHETIVLVGAAIYLLIRFGVGKLLKKYTVHRGMFHSIPAALIAGLLAFLICECQEIHLRFYKAGAVVAGFMSHLILDEIWSIDVRRGRFRLKSSFGTALKLYGQNFWANASTYLKLILLTYLAINDPHWMHEVDHKFDQQVPRIAEEISDHFQK